MHVLRIPVLPLTCFISCGVYSMVRMIITLSSRSSGIPWGELMSSVPLKCKRETRLEENFSYNVFCNASRCHKTAPYSWLVAKKSKSCQGSTLK